LELLELLKRLERAVIRPTLVKTTFF
jgi:hypothetical protein